MVTDDVSVFWMELFCLWSDFPTCRKQLRNAATRTFHDPNAIYSELILWRVDHIGPLSCTGGVSELARINSLHTSAFSNVAWLPTLIPSSVLGKFSVFVLVCKYFCWWKKELLVILWDLAGHLMDSFYIFFSQGLTATVPVHALWHLMVRTCVSIKPWSMPGNYWTSCQTQKHLWVETRTSLQRKQNIIQPNIGF